MRLVEHRLAHQHALDEWAALQLLFSKLYEFTTFCLGAFGFVGLAGRVEGLDEHAVTSG